MKKSKKWLIPIILATVPVLALLLIPKEEPLLTFNDETMTKTEFFKKMKTEPLYGDYTYGESILENHIVGVLLEEKYGDKVSGEYIEEEIQLKANSSGTVEKYVEWLESEGRTLDEVKQEIHEKELVNLAYQDYQPVTEEFLKEKYELMIPIGKVFKQIVVEDEATAIEVIQRVESEVETDEDYEKLVTEYSIDEENIPYGGEYVAMYDFFDPAIEQVIVDLELGEYTKEPVKTEDGNYNVIMIVREGLKGTYEEERDNLLRDEFRERTRLGDQYNELIIDILKDHKGEIKINEPGMSGLVDKIIKDNT